jgi:prepilin-type N-terminal cleavage/methylation domain-containing protein
MYKRLREARQNESGFTLIELLIVIVILGVLAGIVVFAVGAFNNDGVTAACKSDKKNVEIASEAFFAKTGAYPAGADDNTRMTALTPDYLKEIPSSDKYTITLSAAGVVGPASCS